MRAFLVEIDENMKNLVKTDSGAGKICKLSKKRKREKLFKKAKSIDQVEIAASKCVNFAEIAAKNVLSEKIDPQKLAEIYFDWLIAPSSREEFFIDFWEKKHFLVRRNDADFYKGLFSTEEWEKILDSHDIEFGVNLDVVKYENGQRTTLNPEGRAVRSVIWDFYENGASIRLLNPQSYSTSVWRFTSVLQQLFGTFVGANVYLTPPNSQGFAPHFDDIEAFILQLEGRKRWMLYKNKNQEEILARFSSPNFRREELGERILCVDLRPGDLLYLPRGVIHEAKCIDNEHSLHITISTTQLNSYTDFFKEILEEALGCVSRKNVEFRKSLPLNYMSFTGKSTATNEPEFLKLQSKIKNLASDLSDVMSSNSMINSAADRMAKKFVYDSQPLCILDSDDQKSQIIDGSNFWKWDSKNERMISINKNQYPLNSSSKIRLIDRYCIRILQEKQDNEESLVVYYNVENSRIYRKKEIQKFDITNQEREPIEFLMIKYPNFVQISDLPMETEDEKISLCQCLFEMRLLIVSS